MSVAQKAARGALWTMISSMGGRAVGVLGTLVMTRFLHPDQIGEVSVATILAMTGNWITIWGFGQYAVVKGRGPDADEVTWHATFAYAVLGAISLGMIALFGGGLTPFLGAPSAARFVPLMALAMYIKRLSAMPERVLTRQMKFRASGMALVVGETAYTITALGFAWRGHGGWSIVYGNLVQSAVVLAVMLRSAGLQWLVPTPLRRERIADMLRFGVPLGIQGIAHMASRYWDNLAISRYFGEAATGQYNMAYNLADIPAIQVGEQIALVLMPSMAELPPERRAAAFERSTAALSLIIFPLAVGLGLVAEPLIGLILPPNEWQEVAPLLAVLACLSVFRPITWVLSAYFEAEAKTNRLMVLELAKLVILIAGIALLSPWGLRVTSGAVGIAFGLTAIGGVALAVRAGPSPRKLLVGFLQPLLACGVMAAAVLGVRQLLIAAGVELHAVYLIVEIAIGALAYVIAAFAIAPATSRDLISVGKKALRRGNVDRA
jgi:lipopolysaccharide exporter